MDNVIIAVFVCGCLAAIGVSVYRKWANRIKKDVRTGVKKVRERVE